MNSIRIQNPFLLLLVIPLIAAVIIGFFMLPKVKRMRKKNIISFSLHLAMSVLLALAFSDIQFLKTSQKTELYIVCDVSDSLRLSQEKVDDIIRDVYEQANAETDTKVGLVGFADTAEVIYNPGEKYKGIADYFDAEKHSEFNRSSSNLEAALTYTNSLYGDDVVRKMILISDGIETDGSAINCIETLNDDGVFLDAIEVDPIAGDEVAIIGLDYTDHCFVGREETVKVSIKSKANQDITLQLNCEGKTIKEEEVTVSRGLNIINFTLDTTKVGSFDYEIQIKGTRGDTYEENNLKGFTQDYTDKFSVLFIGATEDDYTAFKSLGGYTGEGITTKKYINQYNIPYKLNDLLQYDEIVVSDFDVTQINHADQFVTNLNTAVKTYGKSLITFGATHTNSTDDYVDYYNDMLPVQSQSDEEKAIVFLIDNSGSMETDNRLSKAKQGAIACLDILNEQDFVSVVAFSDAAVVYQPLTSVKNKTAIKQSINRIQTVGGTYMLEGLKAAYNQIKDSKINYKTIITLSDGDPFDSQETLRKYVRIIASNNVICSFINIANSSGESLLKNLSSTGGGFYKFVRNSNQLVDTMVASIQDETGNSKIEEAATLQYRLPNDPVMQGVKQDMPDIEAYNFCHIKSAANTVLTVNYQVTDEETGVPSSTIVPIYAYWTYGKGKVASYTGDLAGTTSKKIFQSTSGNKFFQNSAVVNLPDRAASNVLDMSYTVNGTTTTVHINANDNDKNAQVKLSIKDPEGNESEAILLYDGEQYSGDINTPIRGKYDLHISYLQMDENGEYQETEKDDLPLYFDYSTEYDIFKSDNSNLLYDITKLSGGNLTKEEAKLSVTDEQLQHLSYQSTMIFFVLLAVVLFLVDIFIRKSEFKRKTAVQQ